MVQRWRSPTLQFSRLGYGSMEQIMSDTFEGYAGDVDLAAAMMKAFDEASKQHGLGFPGI
jgi:hypothetical protein